MKKIILIALCILLFLSANKMSAQANTDKVMGKSNWYTGINNNQWNINKQLSQNNITPINNNSVFLAWGFDINYRNFFIEPRGGVGFSRKKTGDISNELRYIVGNLSLGYIVANTKNYSVKIGPGFSILPTTLSIKNNNSNINFDNLNLGTVSGFVQLTTTPITLGATVKADFFKNTSVPIGLNLSYQANVNRPTWQNNNGSTVNSAKESGSWLELSLLIPMKSWF